MVSEPYMAIAATTGAVLMPRAATIEVIKSEHRSLGKVIQALQGIAGETFEDGREPDFALLCAMLYYIDIFQDRMHHPKEDGHLFRALRLHSAAANDLLDELQAEHLRGAQLLRDVERMLVHYRGGAPDGAELFSGAIETYADLHWDHLRKEEQQVLPLVDQWLTEDDCRAMAAAFKSNDDPLFGERPRHEFERLRWHIAKLAPRRMKFED